MTLLVVLFFIALWFGGNCFGAWILMLLLGAFADMTGYEQFALGFWPCFIIALILSLFIGGSTSD